MKWSICIIGILLCFFISEPVLAADTEDSLDYQEIQNTMDEMIPNEVELSFSELVQRLVQGDFEGITEQLGQYVKDQLFCEIRNSKDLLVQMIGIIVLSAVFTNFSMAFSKTFIAETGFYLTYTILFALLLTSFMSAVNIAVEIVENILRFMSVLVPVFCLAVTLTGNIQTGIWYHQAMVSGITLIEWVISKVVLSFVKIYVLISMVNQLSKEDVLSKCADLIKMIVVWTTKTMLGIILGLQFIQGMIMPAIDTVKNSWTSRLTSVVPGVGDVMGGVLKTVIGSAVLIKNGVGSAGLIVLSIICIIPMIKLGVLIFMYLAAQAIVQPVADKRMIACLQCVTEGVTLLLRIEGTVFVLFFLSMAMMTMASGNAFGG